MLTFSNEFNRLRNIFGVEPKVLPMVQVKLRNGNKCEQGIKLLKQMVLARAFPQEMPQQRLNLIEEVFDNSNTLEHLCQISGGHLRNLLVILYSCLQRIDPPIFRNCLEEVIQRQRDTLKRFITDNEWQLLRQVKQNKQVIGGEEYQILLRSMLVFEYQDRQGGWFDINPLTAETKKFAAIDYEKQFKLLVNLEKFGAATVRELEVKTNNIGENLYYYIDILKQQGLLEEESPQGGTGESIYKVSPSWRRDFHDQKKI